MKKAKSGGMECGVWCAEQYKMDGRTDSASVNTYMIVSARQQRQELCYGKMEKRKTKTQQGEYIFTNIIHTNIQIESKNTIMQRQELISNDLILAGSRECIGARLYSKAYLHS